MAWRLGVVLALAAVLAWADAKQTIGWIERVALTDEGILMVAKVDTGADYSSVHADILQYGEDGGRRWVEFALYDSAGKRYVLKRALKREAKVKTKTGGVIKRPVVELRVCIGGAIHTAQFNLAQRAHFKYPLLLGRDFLKSRFLIDPERKNLLTPACGQENQSPQGGAPGAGTRRGDP